MLKNLPPYYTKTKKVSNLIDMIAKDHLKKEGYYYACLLLDWPKIVGEKISMCTHPLKLGFSQEKKKMLTLQVEPAAALMIGFQSGLILQQITNFFGKVIVEEISLKQAPLKKGKKSVIKEQEKPISQEAQKLVDDIDDENLKNALLNLSRHLYPS
ncbi:MAG: hypothetical protein CNLJKLNK_00107 [Holosporales bacterium]